MPDVPNATKSYLIPIGDLTLADRAEIRANVQKLLESNALNLAIRPSIGDMIIRDTLPFTDLAIPGVGGVVPEESWLIPGPGIVGTELQYFSNAIAQSRIVSFFGVGVESAAASISVIRLTLGPASRTSRAVFQLDPLYSRLEPAGYFSSPVVFTRTETCRTMVMPRIAFAVNTERLHLLARTIEPIGDIVSAPSV